MTLTNVVFPLYCRPTRVNSISSFQNKDLNQSRIRLISANIFTVDLLSISKIIGIRTNLLDQLHVCLDACTFRLSITSVRRADDVWNNTLTLIAIHEQHGLVTEASLLHLCGHGTPVAANFY